MSNRSAKYIFFIIAAAMVIISGVISNDREKALAPIASPTASPEPEFPRVLIGGHVFKVDVADEPSERYQGLSDREKLEKDSGMLFIFEKPDFYGFWMQDMRFSIDIIWIKGDRVIGISENLAPTSFPKLFYPPEPADYVLEISAGEARTRGLRAGDTVQLLLESEAR